MDGDDDLVAVRLMVPQRGGFQRIVVLPGCAARGENLWD